jgi:hypothetical protein
MQVDGLAGDAGGLGNILQPDSLAATVLDELPGGFHYSFSGFGIAT